MVGGNISQAFDVAFGNMTLLGLLAALSTLLLGYIQCELIERRVSTDFSLRKLETTELDRALLLFRKASDRVREIHLESAQLAAAERRDRRRRRIELREKFTSELQDLGDYTRDLRSTIARIRSRPLHRYRSWEHVISLQAAFRRSIDAYFLIVLMLSAFYLLSQGTTRAGSVKDAIDAFTQWTPFNSALNAGWLLIGAVVGVLPVFYFRHRSKLRKLHALQI